MAASNMLSLPRKRKKKGYTTKNLTVITSGFILNHNDLTLGEKNVKIKYKKHGINPWLRSMSAEFSV